MNIMNILWSGGISLQSVRKPTAGNLHHHISLPTTPHRLVIPTNNFQTKDIKIKSETKKIRARINLSNYICPPHLTVWSFQIHFSKLIKHCQRQRTRGLSSSYQSNFLRLYHKFKHKSWSNFIFRILTQHQQNISISTKLKIQNLDPT